MPANVTSNITHTLDGISAHIKAHERLIIVLVLAGLGFWGYRSYLNHAEKVAQQQADKTAQELAAQKTVNDQLAAKSAADAQASAAAVAQYQAMVDSLTKQNAALNSQIATTNANLKKQQAANASLDAPGMASRIAQDEKLDPSHAAAEGDGVKLDNTAAHQVLNDLDAVPALTSDLAKETQLKANDDAEIKSLEGIVAAQTKQIGDQANQIAGLTKALADSEANTIKQVNLQIAKDRKSKLHWFEGGVVVGFVAGFLLHGVHGL